MMIWNGETQDQYEERVSKGTLVFAIFPRQMVDGRWVWLGYHWSAPHKGPNMRRWWVNAIDREDCIQKYPVCPPPPSRLRSAPN